MEKARVRTESMVVRLSKQPISEGFDLLDRGYLLGAMRLFIFKADTAPPFEVGVCLDYVGHLLIQMDEFEEATEHFENAAERYKIIMQPILSQLMKVRQIQLMEGTQGAVTFCIELIHNQLEAKNYSKDSDLSTIFANTKTKSAMCRVYSTLAELYLDLVTLYMEDNHFSLSSNNECESCSPSDRYHCEAIQSLLLSGLEAADNALLIGTWDRIHTVMYTKGNIIELLHLLHIKCNEPSCNNDYINYYFQCSNLKTNYLAAYEKIISYYSTMTDMKLSEEQIVDMEQYYEKAISLHPKTEFITSYAYSLSNVGKDTHSLSLLDTYIKNPPSEEAQSNLTEYNSPVILKLLRAKAAILADNELVQEAINCINQALEIAPTDELSQLMLEDLCNM